MDKKLKNHIKQELKRQAMHRQENLFTEEEYQKLLKAARLNGLFVTQFVKQSSLTIADRMLALQQQGELH
jgi:hypothetical protein